MARVASAARAFGLGNQGPALGSDIYQPWDNAVTQVPVNAALWAASDKHYYPGAGGHVAQATLGVPRL